MTRFFTIFSFLFFISSCLGGGGSTQVGNPPDKPKVTFKKINQSGILVIESDVEGFEEIE